MRKLFLLLLIIGPTLLHGQQRINTSFGYIIDEPHLYLIVDTVKHHVRAYFYLRGYHTINVANGPYMVFPIEERLAFGKPFTWKYENGQKLIITGINRLKKKNRKEYKIVYVL